MLMTHAITLMGMSGVGKTYLTSLMKKWGWKAFSSDYDIGLNVLEKSSALTPEDISYLADYLGLLGDPSLGGLGLDEFKRRQKQYYDAEIAAALKLGDEKKAAAGMNFVHDSTGSLCEIEDKDVLAYVGEQTKVVYLEASQEHEEQLIARARAHPKPILYPPSKLDEWVDEFLYEEGVIDIEKTAPGAFALWAFPKLFYNRLPKYQWIAERYGVTIRAEDLKGLHQEDQFLELIHE